MADVVKDFVRVQLYSALSPTDTAIELRPPQAPFLSVPPVVGRKAYLVLMDDQWAPTKFEVVSYTALYSGGGPDVTLTGVTRGELGTTAQSWSEGDLVVMAPLSIDSARAEQEAYQSVSSFLNGWAEHPTYTVRFKKRKDGIVVLEGLITSGTVDSTSSGYAFQLPTGYRPERNFIVQVGTASSGRAEIRVLTDGYVQVNQADSVSSAQAYTILNGVEFFSA